VYRRTSPESEHRLQVTGYRAQGATNVTSSG
jgi:hypothetical protein